ncbi:MAG: hydrogenase [Proteobacteria bacterium]|jgi:hydrogenase-4 component E|nr:hydrogenase [Desulfocapsa sp.]MBU3944254.1 hydrogenase [Pseudomonadota bacterium]MCG2745259.1 hydrogenase [Desulfobacteraceae bacterium]MBU3984529.1 hydrogenase [Pseudomonadota bacterium]MBU4028238.1 hydrogenase [Pseudomonadota bacterium]
MIAFSNALLALTLLSVLLSLASHRLVALVKIMAFQGIVVSLIPLFLEQHMTIGSIMMLQVMILIKGFLIPGFIYVAVKKIKIRREIEPIIGYHASLFTGLIFILISAFIADRIYASQSLPGEHMLLMITAITTLASGLFLLMARYKAITQVIGYLMMENGIYLFGTALAKQTHTQYIVEFGVLLDLLVGIMIMGIVLNNINSTFDDVDTALLGQLKE